MGKEFDFLGYIIDERNNGNENNNLITGNKEKDWVRAKGGNDYILGSEGNDRNDGGEGSDTKDYSNMTNSRGIKANIFADEATISKINSQGEKEYDKLNSIERIKATDGPDEFRVHVIKGEMFVDGEGGSDILNLDLRDGFIGENPENFKFKRKSGLFDQQPYDAIFTDEEGKNTLYINGFEDIRIRNVPAIDLGKHLEDLTEAIKDKFDEVIDKISPQDSEASLDSTVAETDRYALPINDTFVMLDKVRSTLNESGINSELRNIVNHDSVVEMLANLKEDGLELLDVPGHKDQSPEEQIEAILLAAHDATIERGLDAPDESQENSNTAYELGYSNDDNDFSIV